MKFKKTMSILIIFLLAVLCVYALLWLASRKSYPVDYGISFSQIYATSLGLDWKENYLAMLKDLKPKYIRVATMWSEVEKTPGQYDFADVDWMMDTAKEHNSKVTLVVGQKAPRWPECYIPEWAVNLSADKYEESLLTYVSIVAKRYANHEALEYWQVENEPFIRFRFGECQGVFSTDAVYKEINLVRELDSDHPVMVTDSGELSTWRRASHTGDILGTTLYRIVRTPSGRIFTYDWLPPAFYRFKAFFWGRPVKNLFIAELQAEPWFDNREVVETPIAEQMETMSLDRLQKHLDYAERIGSPRAYLWGVEWWYWMKEVKGDSSFWELIKEKI